jgi:hypothetical protein
MVPSRSANPVPDRGGPAVTPDGRYLVVRGRLWRRTNPALAPETRTRLVAALMAARRGVRDALRAGDAAAERTHRAAVHAAKVALGERGPVWWDDGAPDYTRRLARNTPYAAWWTTVGDDAAAGGVAAADDGDPADGSRVA